MVNYVKELKKLICRWRGCDRGYWFQVVSQQTWAGEFVKIGVLKKVVCPRCLKLWGVGYCDFGVPPEDLMEEGGELSGSWYRSDKYLYDTLTAPTGDKSENK